MSQFTLNELEKWNEQIETCARKMGLDCYPVEFEICTYEEMLGYEAYIGMPSHYPHWSFGKTFDRLHTLYRYNLTGLPYEMVINSNPCLAYLMRDNSLLLQILTMAHVYAHNDFFKNNRLFRWTRPELTIEMFKNHAERIRGYIHNPGIGYQKVERILDAAHSIKYQTERQAGTKQLTLEQQKQRLLDQYYQETSANRVSGNPENHRELPDLTKIPLQLEPDLLKFLREYAPLETWEKDILHIVEVETEYFLPQIETKILNEGWASFWHYRILQQLDLPADLHIEFLKQHHQVIRPVLGSLNPYHLGFTILNDLEKRFNLAKLFEVREIENDRSLIRRYLTRELCEELHLFEYFIDREGTVITEVADEEGWEQIRDTLCNSVGMASIPVILVSEISKKDHALILEHEFENRELDLTYTSETLKYLVELWRQPVHLKTWLNGEKTIICDENKRLTVEG